MTTALKTYTGSLLSSSLDYVLLDGSSSMAGSWPAMMRSLQFYLDDLRCASISSQVILSTFSDHDSRQIIHDSMLDRIPNLVEAPLQLPGGMTPLYDGIINLGWTLRDLAPQRCTILIVTDGDENSSKHTLPQAQAILKWLRAKGYNVIFFGCNFDNSSQAAALGMTADNAIGVRREVLSDAARLLAKKRIHSHHSGDGIHFDESERQRFGGYLTNGAGA